MKIVMLMCVCLVSSLFADEEQKKRQSLDPLVFSKDLWSKSLPEIKEQFDAAEADRLESSEMPENLKKKIRNGGRFIFEGEKYGGFEALEWLSSEQNGLRSPGKDFTLLGEDVGEVVIRGKEGKTSSMSISLFNRGDDDRISKSKYEGLLDKWKVALDKKLSVRAESRDKSGVVSVTGWMWTKGPIAFLLEGSLTRKTDRPEFIRLRIALKSSSRGKAKTASRRSLSRNVVKKDGDVFVSNLPMVDQGQKGYCVVASVERVARYYGLQVDQHELAQLADTGSARGTSTTDMEKAFSRITGKIHVKTLKLVDFKYQKYKDFERDIKGYNRVAKKKGAKTFPKDYNSVIGFWREADPEVFQEVRKKEPKYEGFKKHIKKWVNQGVPLCWTLYLGMFQEKEGQQMYGGHMRIIHGYNEAKDEILYTDSWGEGHEMKRMPSLHAWCMTTGLYAMVPTN